jgi:hypothetical protein
MFIPAMAQKALEPPIAPVRKPERGGGGFDKWPAPWVTGLENTKILKNPEKQSGEGEIRSTIWQKNFKASFLPMLLQLLDQSK